MRRRRTLALLKRACTLTLALGMTSGAASAGLAIGTGSVCIGQV